VYFVAELIALGLRCSAFHYGKQLCCEVFQTADAPCKAAPLKGTQTLPILEQSYAIGIAIAIGIDLVIRQYCSIAITLEKLRRTIYLRFGIVV
jgi:hypothetical protein